MKNVYTSIDIGTDSIKIAVCQLFNNKLNLLAVSSVKSKGIKNGAIINEELALQSIRKATSEVGEMLGFEIKKVITSVPSKNAQFLMATGRVEIDEEIGVLGKDVAKLLANSSNLTVNVSSIALVFITEEFKLLNKLKTQFFTSENILGIFSTNSIVCLYKIGIID